MSNKVVPNYKNIGAFNICGLFDVKNFKTSLEYKPLDDDIFICSFPKCGSTWTQNIIYLIFNNGVPLPKDQKILDYVPFLEVVGKESIESKPSPRIIKTHFSYDLIPKNPKAKYIFIIRNPKDCVVSFFHHTKNFVKAFNYEDGKFDDYFELFINGENDYGDYFDHLLSWYPHRSDPNVLFLTYESMKQDPRKNILDIASFIDKKYSDLLLNNTEIFDNILKYSHVSEMQKDDTRWYRTNRLENTLFVRKGEIGDWRNHFTEEQSKRMNDKIIERTKNTDILSLWSPEILY